MTAHGGQGSASPQDGMEKGQSGRKLRRKAEQAQENIQHQSPILASTFFVLNTICIAGTSKPQPQLTQLGWWVVPWYFLAQAVKQTQRRRQMEKAASIQLTPGILAQKWS